MADQEPQWSLSITDLHELSASLFSIGFRMVTSGKMSGRMIQARNEKVIVSWWPWSRGRVTYVDYRTAAMKPRNKTHTYCNDAGTFLSRAKAATKAAERYASETILVVSHGTKKTAKGECDA